MKTIPADQIQRKSSLPQNAKSVFRGKLFEIYQWEQELYDGSTATFEMLSRPDTVQAILVTEGKKIVVSEQEQPGKPKFLGLIGGRSEKGEDILDAIKRETLEEAGMSSDKWELFDAYQFHSKFDWIVYTFIAKNAKKVAEQNLDAGEKIALQEVSFDEFIDIACSDDFRDLELKIKILEMRVQNSLNDFRELLLS